MNSFTLGLQDFGDQRRGSAFTFGSRDANDFICWAVFKKDIISRCCLCPKLLISAKKLLEVKIRRRLVNNLVAGFNAFQIAQILNLSADANWRFLRQITDFYLFRLRREV